MPRLRQINLGNYRANQQISDEFENVIRYLVTGERGDRTIGELMAQLFDTNGNFAGPIEMRLDTTAGLQYRIGVYANPEQGWKTVADIDDLRGPAGEFVGEIAGPMIYNRIDYTATAGQTNFSYTREESADDIAVHVNGLLQAASGVYTYDAVNKRVTFLAGRTVGDKITIYSFRASAVSTYRRSDQTSLSGQSVFPFAHTSDENLLVYRNGLLQKPGATFDFVTSPTNSTVTFMSALSAGEKVTIIVVENAGLQQVAGLMLTDKFCNSDLLIDFTKIAIANDQIQQSKVNGLVTALSAKAEIYIQSSTPSGATVGDLWLDTSQTPNVMKFLDQSSQWRQLNPASLLPTFTTANANQYARVNGTGTAYELGVIDFSSLVPRTFMGAANGVAQLDSTGRLPASQLPIALSTDTIPAFSTGTIANGTIVVKRLYKERVRIDGVTAKLSAGTCTIQLAIDGALVGTTVSVSSTKVDQTFGSGIDINAITDSKRLEIVITSNSAGQNLEVGLAVTKLAAS